MSYEVFSLRIYVENCFLSGLDFAQNGPKLAKNHNKLKARAANTHGDF